jgi:hypothetical protein
MITFGPAQGGAKKIIAGIAGGTGAGKTMSALELGTGLVPNPERELFLIDTEFGRGAHYASAYQFQYGQLSPPFTPERYQAAIEAAIAAGGQCVIVDSLSHMWEGEDGLLDWHGQIALKMARGDPNAAERFNFPAWREPKQALNSFVLFMQRCPVHLIMCLRAKERSKMVKVVGNDGRTKTEIVSAGLQPIIDTATPYEATFLAMLSPEEPGVPHWTHKALASYLRDIFDGGPKQLSREHGRRLAAWCGDGMAHLPPVPPAPEHDPPEPERMTKKRAEQIMAALRGAPNVGELNKLFERRRDLIMTASVEGQRQIMAVYNEALQKHAGPAIGAHEELHALEPSEWKHAEGRVEDERQRELLP